MRGAVLSELNSPLAVEELRDPTPSAGEVLVDVSTCGVCHTDLHVMNGEVSFPLPAVLGHEVSGVVAGVGEGVRDVSPGDNVVCSFIMPCGTCRRCVRGEEDLCETFFAYNRLRGTLYDGTTRLYRPGGEPVWMYSMGGLAEQCVVPATDVFKIPESLDVRDLATLGCSALTAYGAVRHIAGVRPGDSVAVIAVGGVGSSLLQLCALYGASRIVAVDISEEKLAQARRLGATDVVNSAKTDAVGEILELTKGRGVDVAFEALGGPATFRTASDCVTDGGTVVVVGITAAGVTGEIDLSRLPRRKLRVLGSYGGRPRTDLPELLALVERGALAPHSIVSRRYPLDEVADAYSALSRGEVLGRAVIDMR